MAHSSDLFSELIYDGLSPPLDWVRNFSIYALTHKWSEDQQKNNLKLFLTHKAEEVFFSDALDQKASIKEMLEGIIKGCTVDEATALQLFKEAKRGANEPAVKFATRLKALFEIAMPKLSDKQKLTMLPPRVVEGLPAHVRDIIFMDESMTWPKLLKIIGRLPFSTEISTGAGFGSYEPNQPLVNDVYWRVER